MLSCKRCSFQGSQEYFKSKKNNIICKTCERCRSLARKLDIKRSKTKYRKDWCKNYDSKPQRIEARKEEHSQYYKNNKKEVLKRNKKYHESIADKRKVYLREWRRNNKDKMAEYYHRRRSLAIKNGNNTLTSKQIKELMNNHPYCEYCGVKENLAVEHTIPLSRGGTNSIDNVTVACKSCNSSKSTKLLNEWRR